MKIALCLSGLMRTFDSTFSALQENLLSSGHQIDIFIHTWDRLDRNIHSLNIDQVRSIYQPKKLIVEQYKTLPVNAIMEEKNIQHKRDVASILAMYYKIKLCNDLKSQYEKENDFTYDCVIRFRPDIRLDEKLDLKKFDLTKINIPSFGDYFGINDQIAISNSSNMNIYCSVFDHLDEYIKELMMTDPELFLEKHMLTMGMKVNRFVLSYKLLCHGQAFDNKIREKDWLNLVRS